MKILIYIPALIVLLLLGISSGAQHVSINQVKESMINNHPSLRMYDSEAEAMDAAAKGAWSWMPAEAGTGFFMVRHHCPSISMSMCFHQFLCTRARVFLQQQGFNRLLPTHIDYRFMS